MVSSDQTRKVETKNLFLAEAMVQTARIEEEVALEKLQDVRRKSGSSSDKALKEEGVWQGRMRARKDAEIVFNTLKKGRYDLGAALLLVMLLIVNTLVLAAGQSELVSFALSVAVVGIVTFLALMLFAYVCHGCLKIGDTRRALAASIIVVYIILVAMVVFTDLGDSPERTKWIYDNFTVIVITVVAFYFGGTAVERVVEIGKNGQGQSPPAGG